VNIPNADRAIVEAEKVRDYLLSPTHPVGRFKAPFFARLGYAQANWRELQRDLARLALSASAAPGHASRFGTKYEVSAILPGPSGRSATVVTIWMVRTGDDIPRLVTAYPGERS
jgi:hypothetical protein